MKALMRWSATFSLIGGILLGSLLAGQAKVLALTDEEVAERLRPVPVFTLTDAEGIPLIAATESGTRVAGVFISRTDAESFLADLRAENPELANNVQILPVSLATVYELAQRAQEQQSPLRFDFVPMATEVQSALDVLRQNGEPAEQFEGVPIFVARSSQENGGYLIIQEGEQQVIPMFFAQEDVNRLITQLQQQQPDLAASISVEVIPLEGLISTLQTSDNEALNQIMLVPPRETLDFIRSQPPATEEQ